MAADFLELLVRANLAASAVILAILALRTPVAQRFGARAAYGLWLAVPLAAAASLLPARRIVVDAPAAPVQPEPAEPVFATAGVVRQVLADTPAASEPALFPLWLAGAAAFLALLVWRQLSFGRALGRLTPEAGVYRAQQPGVGPALVGALRPRIVLPADFETRFSAEERELVLDHERTHLRRGDHLVNGLVAALQCLSWFNPLAHLAAFHLRLDQELACDAAVLAARPRARRRYAEAMLKTQLAPAVLPLGCHWPARRAHALKLRLAMLAHQPPAPRRVLGFALAGALSLCAGVAAWAAQPPRVERAPPKAAAAAAPAETPVVASRASVLGGLLMEAIDEGYPDTIETVIEAGADVNHYQPGDGTPLVAAARLGDLRTARRLLAAGALVDKPAPGDGSPLIVAAAHGRLEMVALLVEAGADVNQYVRHDETPLINAARHGDLAVVRYLIDRGADPNLAVPSGNARGEMRSPLSMAASPLVAQYLRSRGARG